MKIELKLARRFFGFRKVLMVMALALFLVDSIGCPGSTNWPIWSGGYPYYSMWQAYEPDANGNADLSRSLGSPVFTDGNKAINLVPGPLNVVTGSISVPGRSDYINGIGILSLMHPLRLVSIGDSHMKLRVNNLNVS